jgi:hypothetical protein
MCSTWVATVFGLISADHYSAEYDGQRRRTKEVASAMRWGPGLGFAVLFAVALQWTAGDQPQAETRSEAQLPLARPAADEPTAKARRTLTNTSVGFSLAIPTGWKVTRQVVATEFAAEAACRSVRIVDFQPPPDSGPGAKVLQSFVQICWRRLSGGESLARFVERTYGDRATELFERTELGGVAAYRTKGEGPNLTIFLQTGDHRIQLVASVVAEPTKRALRRAQVQRILASFSATP